MEPNVRLLRYFLAVADTGTFTAAAEVLHVSQPALSQQIRKLEGELGFTVLQRGTRHVTLTPHGKDLISSARQVVEAAQTFRSHARSLAGGTPKLTIGYRAAHESTRAVVDAFRAERPDITVAFKHYPIAATHAGLDAGGVDLAVLRLPVVLTGLRTLTLYTEPRVALLASGHPLASRTRIHLADLAGLPWITTAATDPVWQAHAQPLTGNRDKQNPLLVSRVATHLRPVPPPLFPDNGRRAGPGSPRARNRRRGNRRRPCATGCAPGTSTCPAAADTPTPPRSCSHPRSGNPAAPSTAGSPANPKVRRVRWPPTRQNCTPLWPNSTLSSPPATRRACGLATTAS